MRTFIFVIIIVKNETEGRKESSFSMFACAAVPLSFEAVETLSGFHTALLCRIAYISAAFALYQMQR